MVTITQKERDAIVGWIAADLSPYSALDALENDNVRERFGHYAQIAKALGLGEPAKKSYDLSGQMVRALESVLIAWSEMIDGVPPGTHVAAELGIEPPERPTQPKMDDDHRLKLWRVCKKVWKRIEEEREKKHPYPGGIAVEEDFGEDFD